MADLSSIKTEEYEITLGETKNIDTDAKEAYNRGKVDINFFASLVAPSVMLFQFPYFYVGLFSLLVNRDKVQMGKILRFALGLPRGHAKTTFIKIIIAWLIAYDKISFAVIICANQDLANEIISDVSDMMGSSNAELVYGAWESQMSTDSKEIKKGQTSF